MIFFTAIALGLIGSLHCVGMCGPIALALPLNRDSRWQVVKGNLFYSIGRLTTYLLIGMLLGTVGQGFAFAGWQQTFSIVLGSLMIFSALIGYRKVENRLGRSLLSPFGRLKSKMGKVLVY